MTEASHSDVLYWQGELDIALHEGINGSSQAEEFVQTTYLLGSVVITSVQAEPEDETVHCLLTVTYKVRRQAMDAENIGTPQTIDCSLEVPVDNNRELILEGLNFLDGIPDRDVEESA